MRRPSRDGKNALHVALACNIEHDGGNNGSFHLYEEPRSSLYHCQPTNKPKHWVVLAFVRVVPLCLNGDSSPLNPPTPLCRILWGVMQRCPFIYLE